MRRYDSLRRRGEFLRVRSRGRRRSSQHLVVFALPARRRDSRPRVGFVIPSTVGGAVERNRIRRRLRAILDEAILADAADFVIVAQPGSAACGFDELRSEVTGALTELRA